MNVHHKDKERLRHQKQNKLLNDVMKCVPKSLNGSSLKVKKLRHLVLYYNFMKKVHAQITKDQSSNLKDHKKSTKKSVKSASKSLMEQCKTKKPLRANIIFLQADHSKKEDSKEESFTDVAIIKDNSSEESSMTSEYKVPEVVVVNNIDNSSVVFNNHFLPNQSHFQVISNNSSSTDEFLVSDLSTEGNNNESKVSHPEITMNISDMNSSDQVPQQFSVNDDKAEVPENVFNNDENFIHNKHRKTNFQNILQDYSNNSTLNSETVPYAVNENFYTRNINFPLQNSDYILEPYPFQNSPGYPFNLPSENVILANNNLNYNNLYYFDSAMNKSQPYSVSPLYENISSVLENVSDNCSSSTLTDNLHIDVENFSDSSNGSSKIIADSANDLNDNNVCVTPKTLIYDLPYSTLMNYDDITLPFVSSEQNYFENYNAQNELSVWPVNYIPYINSISPNNINLNEIPPIIQCSEPITSFKDELMNSRFVNDQVSFYSPPIFKDANLGGLPRNSKVETVTSESSMESFSLETKPELFDEEVSFPLSQYINNY